MLLSNGQSEWNDVWICSVVCVLFAKFLPIVILIYVAVAVATLPSCMRTTFMFLLPL